ncbi:hypothetical protein BRD01_08745 [Halobacteriales archaeon QS_8_65_32]|nr:MAG: hypothetical protein BRD01_08745 [Halobacteriales archaeon QS_8_65_32]
MAGPPELDDIDPAAFDDLPNTAVEIDCHVHFCMTGSFPLRLAELFFADDGLYIAEYAYITPMFGLGTKKHRREAKGMAAILEIHGLDEVLLQADSVVWHSYENLNEVVSYDGSYLGRPKIAVHPEHGRVHAYRLHDEDADFDDLAASLAACGQKRGFAVERRVGVGFNPRRSVARFFGRS